MHTHRSGFGRYGHLLVDAAIILVAVAHFFPVFGMHGDDGGHVEAAVAAPRVETVAVERVCFPAASWSDGTVPLGQRPCARISRVHEDGSVTVVVTDADGTFRYRGGIGAQDR